MDATRKHVPLNATVGFKQHPSHQPACTRRAAALGFYAGGLIRLRRWLRFIPKRWRHANDRAAHATNEQRVDDETTTRDGDATTRPAGLAPHLALGQRGEVLAARHLLRNGYILVAANFKANVGRNLRGATVQAEIDIVAYEGATLCFVEVKTRASDWFATPEANVDLRKQRQITRAARAYRRLFGLAADAPHRYDVVTVIIQHDDDGQSPAPRLRLLRNFWTEDKFRKRHWTN